MVDFILVLHAESLPRTLRQPRFRLGEAGGVGEAHLDFGNLPLRLEKPPGKPDVGQHIAVRQLLLGGKKGGRINQFGAEGSGIHASRLVGVVEDDGPHRGERHAQAVRHAVPHDGGVPLLVAQAEVPLHQVALEARMGAVVPVHPLDDHRHGVVLEARQGFLLHDLMERRHLRHALQDTAEGGIHPGILPRGGTDFQVGRKTVRALLQQHIHAVEDRQHHNQRGRPDRHPRHADGGNDIDGILLLSGEEIAAGDEKRKAHGLFQEFVDFVDVVEAVIHKKTQFGNDAHLFSDFPPQGKTDALVVLLQAGKHLLRPVGGENTDIYPRIRQVRTHPHRRDGEHGAQRVLPAFLPEHVA